MGAEAPLDVAQPDAELAAAAQFDLADAEAGVVHNDVKSTNVLLDADGAAFLTDFGIARADDDRPDPEGQRGDLADLARLTWELLVGSPPPAPAATPPGSLAPPSLVSRAVDAPSALGRRMKRSILFGMRMSAFIALPSLARAR